MVRLPAGRLDELRQRAEAERIAMSTLAGRYILAGLDAASGNATAGSSPMHALIEWLGPHLDAIRESGHWSADVVLSIFEHIESDNLGLYRAAANDVGEATLNKHLGRLIRNRLGAEVMRREDGKPWQTRVPSDRTTLVKFYTRLKPEGAV